MSLYGEPKEFAETIECNILGFVSSKCCDNCRVRRLGKCPKFKN